MSAKKESVIDYSKFGIMPVGASKYQTIVNEIEVTIRQKKANSNSSS